MAKWDNMLSMLWMLRSGRKLTAAQIADSLEISVRTVYRYIDALCSSGVPVVAESGHAGGIHILESFKETPLFFTSVELKALADAFKFAQGAGYPYTVELESALKKVENGLHEEQRHELNRQTSGLDVISPACPPAVVPMLRDLEQMMKDGRTICIAYPKKMRSRPANVKSIRTGWLTVRINGTLSRFAIGRRQCGRSALTVSRSWSRPKRNS